MTQSRLWLVLCFWGGLAFSAGAEVRVFIQETNAAAGIGRAEGYKKQIEALGPEGTTLVNIISALADKNLKFVPEVVVGESSGASLSGLLGILTGKYASELAAKKPNEEKA